MLSEEDAKLATVSSNLIKAKDSNLEEQGKEFWIIINFLAISNRLALFGSDHDQHMDDIFELFCWLHYDRVRSQMQ